MERANNEPFLILTHPGSCAGSATFNLGSSYASECRRILIEELNSWRGGVMVIHGELSDELDDFPELADAVRLCATRARADGRTAIEMHACDLSSADWVADVLNAIPSLDEDTRVTITGAWHDTVGTHGCVNAVWDALPVRHKQISFTAFQLDSR